MGSIAFLPILLAAIAFFTTGLVWYGVVFGKVWRRAAGLGEADMRKGKPLWLLLGLAFLFAMLIAMVLAHQFAMTGPSDRAIWMISIGFGAFVITPAIGIAYLYQRRSGLLFAIDAGHFTAAMAAMGFVFTRFN